MYTQRSGQGVGGTLLRALEELAYMEGVGRLQVRVFEEDQAACSFWRHMGYRTNEDRLPSGAYPGHQLVGMTKLLDTAPQLTPG